MASTSTITIDAAGRVVIPKRIRLSLRLGSGSRLGLTEHAHSLVLEPIEQEAVLLRQDGLVLIGGALEGKSPVTRELREEWLDELTGRVTGSRRP